MKNNIHFRIVLMMGILLFIYALSRVCFFFFNYAYFSDIPTKEALLIFIYGIRFDASALFTVNLPLIFFLLLPAFIKTGTKYYLFVRFVFVLLNGTALLFNTIDFVYFRFINTRTSAEIFSYITLSNDVFVLLPQFAMDFWYVPLLLAVLAWLFWRFFARLFPLRLWHTYLKISLKHFMVAFAGLVIWAAVSLFFIRGGLQLRPINIASASAYTSAKYIPLVLNTPFNIIKTVGKEKIVVANYFKSSDSIEKYFNHRKYYHRTQDEFKPYNIIIFILESFSKEHSGFLNPSLEGGNYKGYTPFLDSIMAQSLTFRNAYANGKRTIDAPPAILASIPNLMNTAYVLSPYASNNLNSVSNLLKPYDYTSYFFHGGTNGTMAFDNFANLTGFDNYYGRSEYNNDADFDGKWGIFDEPFLQRMADVLSNAPSPFVSCVFTLSSHHPYTIPDAYKDAFPQGTMETHQSIGYADYALRKFFEKAVGTEWFSNTLFIFTADHTSEAHFDIYKTKKGCYSVPIVFYMPAVIKPELSTKTAQHTDILPTIMDIINYPLPFTAFGQSLLRNADKGFAVNYADGLYQYVDASYVLAFDSENSISLFHHISDTLLHNNILSTIPDTVLKPIENRLKAYIQSYQMRMTQNSLTTEIK